MHCIQQLEHKLDLMLKVAACFGHDSIILWPVGCGGERHANLCMCPGNKVQVVAPHQRLGARTQI